MMTSFRKASVALVAISVVTATLGYGRELLLAKLLGVGASADAFYLSLGFVQTMGVLVFSGSLIAVVAHRPLEDDIDDRSGWASALAFTTLLGGIGLAGLVYLGWGPLLKLLGAGSIALPLASRMGSPLSLLLPLDATSLALCLLAASRQRYIASVLPPLVSAACFFGLLLLTGAAPATLALCAIMAAAAGLIWILLWSSATGEIVWRWPRLLPGALTSMWLPARPNLLALGFGGSLGLLLGAHLLIRLQAAGSGGAVAALLYAYRLYEAPLTVLLYPAVSIIAPLAASSWMRGQQEITARLCADTILWILILLVPIAYVVGAASTPIVSLALQRGRFDPRAVASTAAALRGFAPVIVFEAIVVAAFRLLPATGQPARPVAISAIVLGAMLLLCRVWRPAAPGGFATCLTLAFFAGAVAACVLLRRRLGWRAMPRPMLLLRWALAGALGLVVFTLAARLNVMTGVIAGLAIYGLGVLVLLPEQRRRLLSRP